MKQGILSRLVDRLRGGTVTYIRSEYPGLMSPAEVSGSQMGIPDAMGSEELKTVRDSIYRAWMSQQDTDRVIASNLHLMLEDAGKDLILTTFRNQHASRKNFKDSQIILWAINIIKKYCYIKAILYTQEPERIFFHRDPDSGKEVDLDEKGKSADKAILKACRKLLETTKWSLNIQQAERLMHAHRTVFLQPYHRTDRGFLSMRVITRDEIGIDPSPDDPTDIDAAQLIYVVGPRDIRNNKLVMWHECWTQSRFLFLSRERSLMTLDPTTNKPYADANPYMDFDEKGRQVPFMPFVAIHEHDPYRYPYCPVPTEMHDVALNLSSMSTDIMHSMVWSLFGFFHAAGWDPKQLPKNLAPEILVQSANSEARLDVKSLPPNFKAGLEGLIQQLKLWAVMNDFPPNLVTRDVHERTADAILASRMDLENVRISQLPRWRDMEPKLWAKCRYMHNRLVELMLIDGPAIPDDIEMRVVHHVFEPRLNTQSSAQASATDITAGISTAVQELAERDGITLEEAAKKLKKQHDMEEEYGLGPPEPQLEPGAFGNPGAGKKSASPYAPTATGQSENQLTGLGPARSREIG